MSAVGMKNAKCRNTIFDNQNLNCFVRFNGGVSGFECVCDNDENGQFVNTGWYTYLYPNIYQQALDAGVKVSNTGIQGISPNGTIANQFSLGANINIHGLILPLIIMYGESTTQSRVALTDTTRADLSTFVDNIKIYNADVSTTNPAVTLSTKTDVTVVYKDATCVVVYPNIPFTLGPSSTLLIHVNLTSGSGLPSSSSPQYSFAYSGILDKSGAFKIPFLCAIGN